MVQTVLGQVAAVLREGTMTNADKKAYLSQYGMLNDRINRWEMEKKKWEDMAQKV